MVTVPTLLRKARSTALARAHADRGAPAVTAAAAAPDADANHAQNNFVNNSQATDNGRPPPVPAKDTNSPRFLHRFSTIRDYRTSRIDLSTAVESESSIQAREKQLDKQSSISQLRRRLVRKASTFNLNSRRLVALSPVTNNSSNRRSAHLFLDADTDSEIYPPTNTHERSPSAPEILRSDTASTVYSTVAETIISRCELPNATDHDSTSANTAVFTPSQPSSHQNRETREINTFPSTWAVQEPVYTPTGTEPHLNTERHIGKTMAATPPLPYEVLKKITVDACESALSDVKAYDHPKTEAWNTKIINTILAQLVTETSKPSESSDEEPEAPRYKFVVNSTIVQHRNAYSDSPNSRRGMHSAAGAYWNNEKDGMWSFKYDAGDSKGLDVVVGIVWVWVG